MESGSIWLKDVTMRNFNPDIKVILDVAYVANGSISSRLLVGMSHKMLQWGGI